VALNKDNLIINQHFNLKQENKIELLYSNVLPAKIPLIQRIKIYFSIKTAIMPPASIVLYH